MTRRTRTARNAARVLAAGLGLLALVICVGITLWLFSQAADTYIGAGKKARGDVEQINRQLREQTETLQKMIDERGEVLDALESTSQPSTAPATDGGSP